MRKKSHKTNCTLSFSVSFVLLLIYNIVFCMCSMIVSYGLASFGFLVRLGLAHCRWGTVCSSAHLSLSLSFIGSIFIICCWDARMRLSSKFIIFIFHLRLCACLFGMRKIAHTILPISWWIFKLLPTANGCCCAVISTQNVCYFSVWFPFLFFSSWLFGELTHTGETRAGKKLCSNWSIGIQPTLNSK